MDFDKSKYRIWTWKHPLVLHWIINPGLAFNELVLGQRIPKVTLIEKNSDKPLVEKTFVPCPHCQALQPGAKWTAENNTAFGNWFGLYCDHCGKIIPCVTNLTTYIILGLTFPIWIWLRDTWKQKWLLNQKEKFAKPLILAQPEYKWWYVGLQWGLIMYVSMEIIFPLINGDPITTGKLLIGIPVWAAASLIFGFLMKIFIQSKSKKQNGIKPQPS